MNNKVLKVYEPNCSVKNALLAIHGLAGSKNSHTIGHIAKYLAQNGGATVAIDLPGHGDNSVPITLDNCLNCIQDGVKYVENHYRAPMFLYAASFGAYLSLIYVMRNGNPFRHIILRSPAVEMAQSMISTDKRLLSDGAKKIISHISESFYKELQEHDLFEAEVVPFCMTIIHGGSDQIVELSVVKKYIELKASQANLIVFENSGHNMRSTTELAALSEVIGYIVKQ